MRKLFSGRRRYALACLLAAGGLLTAAASCEPTKTPVKPPPPTGLSIEPTSHDFGTSSSDKTFTVTNNGPNTSGTLEANVSGDTSNFSVSPAGAENTCEGQTLAASDTCIVVAHFNTAGSGPKQADLTVKSDVSADGEAVAKLTGTA
ncbi:MAG TPA: hypothetical protein VEM59_07675 [Acidimicrobiia bacterium]|nr:hypothetical protein [Acidimicrobiia bacterium]